MSTGDLDEGSGDTSARRLLDSIVSKGVAPLLIARELGVNEESLEDIRSGQREASLEEFKALEKLHRSPPKFGPHLKDNQAAIGLIDQLYRLGLTEKTIARGASVGGPYISQIIHGHRNASPPLVKRLHELLRRRVSEVVRIVVEHSRVVITEHFLSMSLVGTAKSPCATLSADRVAEITGSVSLSLFEAVSCGSPGRVALPSGIPAAAVELSENLLLIAIDSNQCSDAKSKPMLRAHEMKAIANWLLAKANELEGGSDIDGTIEQNPNRWG